MYSGNPFRNIQLDLRNNKPTVQYSVDPEFNEPGPRTYTLTAYEDLGLKKSLYSIDGSSYYITDDSNTRQNSLPGYVYTLTLTDGNYIRYSSDWFGWHPDDHLDQHKYLIASDISRREHVRFNYVGLFGYLLRRKNYNEVEESDVDPVTGEALVDNNSSFGVGKTDGYYDPVLFRFSIEGREVNTDLDPDGRGTQTAEMLKVRSSGFPYLEVHDIVVMGDGKRYILIKPDNKYYPGTTTILLQTPTLRLVPPTDTIYSINVPTFPA